MELALPQTAMIAMSLAVSQARAETSKALAYQYRQAGQSTSRTL
jgi:hypothetical protein